MAKTKLTFRTVTGKRTSGENWRTASNEDRSTRAKRDSSAKSWWKSSSRQASKAMSKFR